jgi:peptidoglycan/LPS O-acetylase OafA/YrhL
MTAATQTDPAPTVTAPGTGGAARNKAFDGLRAIAVLGVLLYHAGQTWLPGGLLGVDVFFVLSGFLITGLMIREFLSTGRIRLRRFWARRARRLLPALLLLLLGVAGYARWFADPSQLGRLRLDALATLGYVANWRFAFSGQGYFQHFQAPSPLLHMWSLGVEEQFYLLWPLLVVLVLRRRASLRLLLIISVAGAIGSAVLASVLTGHHVDPSRVYYGTDTRAQALLVGAALATWTALRPAPVSERGRRLVRSVGLAGAGVLVATFMLVGGESSLLYRGGFLVVALAVAGLLSSIAWLPQSPQARLLGVAPLAYLGRISYGVYVWHWPLFLVLTSKRTGLDGVALLGVRFAVTLATAALSFHLVENPIRRGALFKTPPRWQTAVAVLGVAAVVTVATIVPAGADQDGSLAQESQLAQTQGQAAAQNAAKSPTMRTTLLVGDSVALTLGVGLDDEASKYNMKILNGGTSGCGVARWWEVTDGQKDFPAYDFCNQWPQRFTKGVRDFKPDVSMMLVGRWETYDRLIRGRWVHIGDPSFDAYLAGELDTAIKALGTNGTPVVLLTTPVFDQRESPDGGTYPQDEPSRVMRFNELLRAAAARHPGTQVFDLEHMLTADGHFHRDLGGSEVRWADGIHIARGAGQRIADSLLPYLNQVAEAAPDAIPAAPPTTPLG